MRKIIEDLEEMKKKLGDYVNKGRAIGFHEVRKEPVIAITPDKSKIKPLKKMKNCDVHFMAVDCSTRTLKRANNWGVYLMRAAYASVEGRNVDWGYEERMCTVIGDAYGRSNFLKDFRIELESQMGLKLLRGRITTPYYDHTNGRSNYLLLDGGAYFGGERKFRVSLYEECKKEGINLLAISKNSPLLHDDKGRDFVATTTMLSPYGVWVYHPIRKANKDQTLYGDISVVKLYEESPRVFRCDIMDYLTKYEINELLSPLISISEDPRCLGYPVTLWLAHDFSGPSDSKLLHYHDQVEETLATADLLDVLRMEEVSCNFPDELHGVKHPFQWEWIEHV
ncbi:MAG: DNA double-strand break repair nuclease NurA [Candidatus Bathyarchaeota archaeon]|nr:DNA double-strand break repair nuclease NurA [Candidatus Bathyarchaeota archaeon]MDH5732686.1 DNA double-strand break repair nuclease NurA [Candidatus Bathyarchaeota archaeon]